MELRHLKHFLVLAKLKHFNRAAVQLNLAQPSLSRSIQKMEERLGVKLLERNSKSVSLTEFGELVVRQGQKIIDDVDLLYRDIRSLNGLDAGDILIGSSPIPSNALLGAAIGNFIRLYPHINVELIVESPAELYERLIGGGLSMFVAETKATDFDKRDELATLPLPEYDIIFCVRADHPLMMSKVLMLDDLREYPLAIPRAMPSSVQTQFGDLFDKDRHDFGGLVKFDQFYPIKESLLNCNMVAITPEIAVRKELAEGRLVSLPVSDMVKLTSCFSIVYLKSKSLSPVTTGFIEFLLNCHPQKNMPTRQQSELVTV
ncbi:LysR family transcriptional regulator [Shewanella pealeana]|uniref:Transcriptional regulator, LysR family n=1 Tax=Shewanella pealeana (strain ATCC 700345 / ANG-SQ1) TaxID=398579 RepID=A8H855_SHEPA|nr:LysR family transcriptional regulator [Shewanella pealeana]ABV88742.1 transcriptional regulator, LysR family [Shewanella pealeana ATCC 700345]